MVKIRKSIRLQVPVTGKIYHWKSANDVIARVTTNFNDTSLLSAQVCVRYCQASTEFGMSSVRKPDDAGFVHSVKVPRLYKTASSIVKRVVESGESLKHLVYSSRHKNIKGVYALVVETIKHSQELDKIMKKSELLQRESRLEPWLARILVTEMLYRGKELKGNSKPIQTVLSYKEKLSKHLGERGKSKTKTEVLKPRYVRVNTIKNTPDEVIKMFRDNGWTFLPPAFDYPGFLETVSQMKEYEFTKDFHIKELLVFPNGSRFYKNELYLNGGIILQDKASCLPVFLLRPPPNSTVLDMCAAPGMKTSHLSAKMKNKGTVYAVEKNSSRYNTMSDFVKKVGCKNVQTLNMDALLIGKCESEDDVDTWYKDVEYILVDPSCSGTGIVERNNIFIDEKLDRDRIKRLCAFQFRLLLHALTNFPNVKRVVYSTCSLLPEENEKVVEDVLRKLSDCQLTDELQEEGKSEKKFEVVEALKEEWPRRGSDTYTIGKQCLYADPEKDFTNGFFIAVFERVSRSEFRN